MYEVNFEDCINNFKAQEHQQSAPSPSRPKEYCIKRMNLSTNPFYTHGIDKLCTICHLILEDTGSHSVFSTLEELESPGPMNVLQVLQSFSNFFYFYNGPEKVCTTCYDKTIETYKFIQMCNKAHENIQHYLKTVETIKTIKEEPDVDVEVEEISIAPTTIIIDGGKCVEEMKTEEISKFLELEMVISPTEIKIEETILQERMERQETSNNEEITLSHTEIVTAEKIGSSDFDNLNVEIIDAQIFDERIYNKELGDHRKEVKHTKEEPFLSELCKASFGTKSLLNTHMSVDSADSHNEVKPLKCEQCDRRFTLAGNLRRHMDIHYGVKMHKCERCDQRFIQTSDLRRHMDIHNGIKAHKCEQCERRFTRAASLRRHMDIHNGVKAHICVQCDRRFTQAVSLRRHMIIHNRKLSYN